LQQLSMRLYSSSARISKQLGMHLNSSSARISSSSQQLSMHQHAARHASQLYIHTYTRIYNAYIHIHAYILCMLNSCIRSVMQLCSS
jgi:hypothetical protein